MARLVVVAPLAPELPRGLDGRSDVLVQAVGMRSAWPASGPLPAGAAAVVITGTCGALAGDWSVGSLVVPDGVVRPGAGILHPDGELREGLLEAARRLGLHVAEGRLAEADAVVDDAADRERLHAASGASFVDMESASLAALAASRGIPWAIVRIVTDTPDRPLDWLDDLLGGLTGAPGRRRVAAALVRRPWHVLRLARLALAVRRGTGRIGRIVEAWLDGRAAI